MERKEENAIGQMRIMVVEDERIVAMDTEELLRGLGTWFAAWLRRAKRPF